MNKKEQNSLNDYKLILKNIYFLIRNKVRGYDQSNTKELFEFNKHRTYGPKKVFCQAPFNSMMFDMNGKVRFCLNNYGDFEQYPQKKIIEIWKSEMYSDIREHIGKNILPSSCDFCKTAMLYKSYDTVMAMKFDHFAINNNGYPSYMEFFADNTCNLECVMCNGRYSSSIRVNREKLKLLPKMYDSNFITQLREFIPHLKTINFAGGEPFLIKFYYDIWELVRELNPKVNMSITTNGTILNERIINILENGNFSIIVSLDSLNEKTYESIRVNSVFRDVMKNLDWFHKYTISKNTSLNVNMCILRETWSEVPAMLDFCNKLDCTIFFCDVLQPFQHAIWTQESIKIKEIFEHLSKFNFSLETKNNKFNSNQYKLFLEKLESWFSMAVKREALINGDMFLDNIIAGELFLKKCMLYTSAIDKFGEELFSEKITEIFNNLPPKFFTQNLIKRIFENSDETIIFDLMNDSKATAIDVLTISKYFSESEFFFSNSKKRRY